MNDVITQASDRLRGLGSHVPFEDAVEHVPFEKLSTSVEDLPYTIWQLVEHVRIVQRDILDYTLDPSHESPSWPEGYWPEQAAPVSEDVWRASISSILEDRETLISILEDGPSRTLEGTDHTVLREVLIAASHLSYHTGQIVLMCRLLDCYRPST